MTWVRPLGDQFENGGGEGNGRFSPGLLVDKALIVLILCGRRGSVSDLSRMTVRGDDDDLVLWPMVRDERMFWPLASTP